MANRSTEKLRAFADRLTTLRAEALRKDLAPELRGTVLKLVADEFRGEVDPYGKKWAPLKRERTRNKKARKKGKRGGQKILQNTGRLRASIDVRAQGSALVFSLPVAYATFHQSGTRHMVDRKIVPDAGPSPIWNDALRRDVQRLLKERMAA